MNIQFRIRKVVALLVAICSSAVLSAPALHAQDILADIFDEGMNRSQIMESISWLTDVSGGRLTNSPSMFKAASWTQRRLNEWGIQDVWTEEWGPFGQGWSNEKAWVRMVEPDAQALIFNVVEWTEGTNGIVSGPAILVSDIWNQADLDRYRGTLKGAFVLLEVAPPIAGPLLEPLATRRTPEELLQQALPRRPQTRTAMTPEDSVRFAAIRAGFARNDFLRASALPFFKEEGVAAIVLVSETGVGGTVFLDTTFYGAVGPKSPSAVPIITMAKEHYGRIVRILEKGLPVTLEAEINNTFHGTMDDPGINVIAEIPGTGSPEEVVMLGAHLDGFSYSTSTTDNAANVGVMMEAMRILKAVNAPMKRTVRLGLWTGEEQGLYGSKAYVNDHFINLETREKTDAFDHLAAYYNLDNGTGAIRGAMSQIDIQPNSVVDSTFTAWTMLLPAELGLQIVSKLGGGGTDHVSFYTNGLPGFQFMQDWLSYWTVTHHSNMDTYERVPEADVKKNAIIVASFVYLTANQETLFPRTITR